MICFNNTLFQYSYNYFDENNQLQTKQLNIFQLFARNVFGCYAETHLSNVVDRAYILTLNNEFDGTDVEKTQIIKLIAKANQVYTDYRVTLQSSFLPNGEEVCIKVHYDANATGMYIDSVRFDLNFVQNNLLRSLYIYKSSANEICARPLSREYSEFIDDTKERIKARLNHPRAIALNNLAAKILSDSSISGEITEMFCFADDYKSKLQAHGKDISEAEGLNETQQEEMEELGWGYLEGSDKEITPLTIPPKVYKKRKYHLNTESVKDHENLANGSSTQKLSLAFAYQFLAPKKQPF